VADEPYEKSDTQGTGSLNLQEFNLLESDDSNVEIAYVTDEQLIALSQR